MKLNLSYHNNISFRGYDAVPLKGIYMQGMVSPCEKRIFEEMKSITQKEGIDLFINENNAKIKKGLENLTPDNTLSIWGQDNKAFVDTKNVKKLLWHSKERVLDNISPFNDYKLIVEKYLPRGGNYFLGYKDNGETWLMINTTSISSPKTFEQFGDIPTMNHLTELFDVKKENIYPVREFWADLDEMVRPVGYPYVLVNDFNASLKNLEKMKEKFPEDTENYSILKEYLDGQIVSNSANSFCSTEDTCKTLEGYGFKPIRIAGVYNDDINFMNAIVHKKDNNTLSYITNSTQLADPSIEYLETLFKEDLKEKMPNVDKVYFVSGGEADESNKSLTVSGLSFSLPDRGLSKKNAIMDIFANRLGGIHCMSAEIPDFDKLNKLK